MRALRITCLTMAVAAGLAAQVKLPPYTRTALANGAVLILAPRADLPLVTFRVLIKGGSESDPAGKPGLASLTAQLLRKGTAKRTADQFSDELDGLGGTFMAFANDQATLAGGEFLKKDFAAGLDLVADAVFHPAFPEEEAKKAVAQAVDRARSLKDNPGMAVNLYFRAFFFGPKHPYGRPPDEETLNRITRDDIIRCHDRLYTGKNLIVVVAGDIDPATAGPAVAKVFGAASEGEPYQWVTDAPPARGSQPRLLLVDKPDATQTYFEIGQPGITRTSPDRVPLWLVNTLFGGRFTSMLNEALRVNSGLTYGANCRLQQSHLTGAIAISTYTKTDSTERAVDIALDLLKGLHDRGITAEQLASAKAYLKGLYPREALETTDQLANVVGEMELYGLNRGEVDDLFSRIDAVTLEQANAVAKKYYQPENLTFVLLGNASKIRDAVKKYAPSIEEVSIKQPGFGPVATN